MESVKILSVDAREIRSRPAPKASVGRKELTAWSDAASTWMVWARTLDARLTNNGKQASSLSIQHEVIFGLATVAFMSAPRESLHLVIKTIVLQALIYPRAIHSRGDGSRCILRWRARSRASRPAAIREDCLPSS